MSEANELLTASEAAAKLKVSKASLRAWTLAGCPAVRIGRLRRFVLQDLAPWLEEREAARLQRKQDTGQQTA
jgi:excisionase family DNA binding protein